ncbi:Efflux pump terJ [Paramyrothecium foliicola]|nr:Efflux pump terJ [Paramyrothecium foliicola]
MAVQPAEAPDHGYGSSDGVVATGAVAQPRPTISSAEVEAVAGIKNGRLVHDAETAHHDDDTDSDLHSKPLPFSKARCIALVMTVTGAAFLNTLSAQSVVIIMPTIGRELGIPESRLQWIVSSYSLTFGCFLLLWGRVADIYGKRLIFIAGSVWVTAMTAANPFVPNEIAFNLFRGLHGLGAAANVPTAIGILGVTFPPGKAKNYAFSTYAAGAPLGSVFGNLLSGLVAEYASWKWVFGITAIMAAAISVAGIFLIPPRPPSARLNKNANASIDWIGAASITIGLIALMFALTEGNVVGWSTPWIPVLLVVSVLIIVAFAFWQRHLEKKSARPPLIRVSIFRNLRFSAVMLTMALFFASFNNFLVFATYYYQGFQGLSPLQTMLRFIPTGVAGCITAAIVAQLLSRIPTFYIIVCGTLAAAVSSLLFAVPIPPSTSYFAWGLPAMVLSVVGADTIWPCLTLFTSQALRPEDQAVGGALINAMGQFGRAIGLAVSTAAQTAVMADGRNVAIEDVGAVVVGEEATLQGIRAGSWVNFGAGVGALLVVLLVLRSNEIIGRAKAATSSREAREELVQAEEKQTTEQPAKA